MTTISTKLIRDEHEQIMLQSKENDGTHFSLQINPNCEISQLGFSTDSKFNSVLIIINTLEGSYVKGNLQLIAINNTKIDSLSKDGNVFISFKKDEKKLSKLFIQTEKFQCKVNKKNFHFTENEKPISSIYVYYDIDSVETLLIADPFNSQSLLTISSSTNGTFGSLIKNMLVSSSLLTAQQFESISLGNSNDK